MAYLLKGISEGRNRLTLDLKLISSSELPETVFLLAQFKTQVIASRLIKPVSGKVTGPFKCTDTGGTAPGLSTEWHAVC